MGMAKRIVYACSLGLVSVTTSLALFHLGYRFQIIDFYKPELASYNRPVDLRPGGLTKTILILGDSFGVGQGDSYPVRLRKALPSFRVINSSIKGTGSIEARLVAPRRFSQFHPDVFIYQIYVGNDLFDIRYPTNYGKTDRLRWAYWGIANHLGVLKFLNYRLAEISSLRMLMSKLQGERTKFSEADLMAPFSVDLVSHRERTIFLADPRLLDETINLKGQRRQDFLRLVDNVRQILDLCKPTTCKPFVLVIPHKVQVSREYARQYETLGATFAEKDGLMNVDYPFVRELRRCFANKELILINPLAILQNVERSGTNLYFVNDEHMNSNGHQFLAQSLLDAIGHHVHSAPMPLVPDSRKNNRLHD
jgi:hypothetical protein